MINHLTALMTRIASAIRAVLGVPDYDRYLTHMRSAHPGDRVMSETEFRHTWMNDRYNRPGTRCC